jgi:hypothetical protein
VRNLLNEKVEKFQEKWDEWAMVCMQWENKQPE